jgi:predicted DsbA family dithiol-disulfide isomerase
LIDDVLKKYPNDVKVVFKSFPLSSHKQAFKASKYAIAAGRQGKFNEMFHAIFADDAWKKLRSNEDLPLQLAAEIGLDIDQLNKDMNDPTLDAQIQQEAGQLKALGNSYETDEYAGVRLAVPKFFINGREPAGRGLADWSKVIEEELKK